MTFRFIYNAELLSTNQLLLYLYNLFLLYFYWDIAKFILTVIRGKIHRKRGGGNNAA